MTLDMLRVERVLPGLFSQLFVSDIFTCYMAAICVYLYETTIVRSCCTSDNFCYLRQVSSRLEPCHHSLCLIFPMATDPRCTVLAGVLVRRVSEVAGLLGSIIHLMDSHVPPDPLLASHEGMGCSLLGITRGLRQTQVLLEGILRETADEIRPFDTALANNLTLPNMLLVLQVLHYRGDVSPTQPWCFEEERGRLNAADNESNCSD